MNFNLWQPLILTLELALITTVILLVVGTPIAWWLSRTRSKSRPIFEAITALPLVLPPTVLGFYLLLLLGPEGSLGQLSIWLSGQHLAFTFIGLVIGSCIYSLPFAVQPLQSSFIALGNKPLELAATMGFSPVKRFFRVILPCTRPGYFTAAVLTFSHTLGEFGVVLMIGGNIPGKTKVASIAIYEQVESLQYADAHRLSVILLILSFVLLLSLYWSGRATRVRSVQ